MESQHVGTDITESSRGEDPLNEAFDEEEPDDEEIREVARGTILPGDIVSESKRGPKEIKSDEFIAGLEDIFQSSCEMPSEMLMVATTVPSFLDTSHLASASRKSPLSAPASRHAPGREENVFEGKLDFE